MPVIKSEKVKAKDKLKVFGIHIREIENGFLLNMDDDNFVTKTWYAKTKDELKKLIESKTKL